MWSMLLVAVASASPEDPPACHGPCRPRCDSAYDPPEGGGRPSEPLAPFASVPRFYLHDEGGFDYSPVSAAVDQLLGGSPPDMVLPIGTAQHFFEYPLLRALRTHPRRTLTAGATEVHVIGAMPFVSWAFAEHGVCIGACPNGSHAEHEGRMRGVADALRSTSTRYWGASRRRGTPFVLLSGHYAHARHVTEPLARELSRGHAVLAVADPMHAQQMRVPRGSPLRGLVARGISVPYWAHSQAASAAGDSAGAERIGVMFHGGLGRYDFATRDRTVRAMRLMQARGDPVDLRVAEFTRGGNATKKRLRGARRAAYEASGRAYQNASLCASPSGDTTRVAPAL